MDQQSESCISTGDEDLLKVLKMVRQAIKDNNQNIEVSTVADLEKEISSLIANYHAAQKEIDCLEMRNIDLLSREIELNSKCVRYQMNVAIMENIVKEQERKIQFKDDEARNIRLILEQRIEEENRNSMQRDITEYELSAKLADREETLNEMEALLGEKENVIERLEGSIHQLTEEIFTVNEVIDRQHTELEEKEIDLKKASEQSCKLGNENKLLYSKIHQINEKSEVLKRSLEDLENDLVDRNNDCIEENTNELKSEERIRNLQCIIQNYERKCDKITDSLLEFGNENDCLSERICDILSEIEIEEDFHNDNNDNISLPVDEVKLAKVNRNSALNAEANIVRKTSGSKFLKRSGMLFFESPNRKQHTNIKTDEENNKNVSASSKALLETENRLKNEKHCDCLFASHKDTNGISNVCIGIKSGNGFSEKQPDQIRRQQKAEGMDVGGVDMNENALVRGEVIDQKKMNNLPPNEFHSSINSSNDSNIKETTQQAEQNVKGLFYLPREVKHSELQDELDGSIAENTNSDVIEILDSSLEGTETNNNIDVRISDDSILPMIESSQEVSAQSFKNICKDNMNMSKKVEATDTPTKSKSLYVLRFLDENNVNTTPKKEQHLRFDGVLLKSVSDNDTTEGDANFHEIHNDRNDGNSEKILLKAGVKRDEPITVEEREASEIAEDMINKVVENIQLDKEENEKYETEIPVVFTATKDKVTGNQEELESREQIEAFPMQLQNAEPTLILLDQHTEMDVSAVNISKSEVQTAEEVPVEPDCTPPLEALTTADKNASDLLQTEKSAIKEEYGQAIDFSQEAMPMAIESPFISAENKVPNTLLVEVQIEPEASVPSVDDTVKNQEAGELSTPPIESVQSVKLPSAQDVPIPANGKQSMEDSCLPDVPVRDVDSPAVEHPSVQEGSASDLDVPSLEKLPISEASAKAIDGTSVLVMGESVGVIQASLEEPRLVQGIDVTTVDVPAIETPSIQEAFTTQESLIPEATVSGSGGPTVDTPSLNEATFSVENDPSLEAPSDLDFLIPTDDVPSSFAPKMPDDVEKDGSFDPVIAEGPFIVTDDLSIRPGDVPEEELIISEVTTATKEENLQAPIATLEGGVNTASNADETISKTSFPVSDINGYGIESKPLYVSTEGNESELSGKVQIRLVEKFDDEGILKRSLSKEGEFITEPVNMGVRMDRPLSSSGEMPSNLVSSLIKENMQLRKNVEEFKEEKSMLVDEINTLKSRGDVEKNLKETLDTAVAEKLSLVDQVEALKGIMLDFDEKYKEETAKLEESKEKLKVELEQMTRNLAKKEEYLLAAKERENYFMSLNEKKGREVAGLEAKLQELSSEKESKECEKCVGLSKEVEEERMEVENLKAKIALSEVSYDPGALSEAQPSPSSCDSSEVVNESYGAKNVMEPDEAGGNKVKKKKRYPIFCS